MNNEKQIQDIVTRANKIWLPDSAQEDGTIAVTTFISDKGNLVQVWLSHWTTKKCVPNEIENNIFEHSSLEGALAKLSAWVYAMSDVKPTIPLAVDLDDLFFHKEGDRIAGKIGFGD